MKTVNIKGIPAKLVVFDYEAIGGTMRAFCAELTARQWLQAHGFWSGPVEILEIVEWERSPTDRSADVMFRLSALKATFREMIAKSLPILTGGVAEAGDQMQFELDGVTAFFDHSCAGLSGFATTGPGSDGGEGFTLDPAFAKAWWDRGTCRLRLHTQRVAGRAAA